jgi:hypothetical protein
MSRVNHNAEPSARQNSYDEAEAIAPGRVAYGGVLARTCPACGKYVQEFGKGRAGANFMKHYRACERKGKARGACA